MNLIININLYNYKDYFNKTKISFKPFIKRGEKTFINKTSKFNNENNNNNIMKIIFFDHKRRIPKLFLSCIYILSHEKLYQFF